MPLFRKQVQQFAAQDAADKLRFEDPNHVIDEDYLPPSRLKPSDLARFNKRPTPTEVNSTGNGYIIIGGMFIMVAMVFLYSCQPAVAVMK